MCLQVFAWIYRKYMHAYLYFHYCICTYMCGVNVFAGKILYIIFHFAK